MVKRLGTWAFIAAGVVVAAWSALSWLAPVTSCRGAEMGPGDTCAYASLTNELTGKVQRYEERIATIRQQAPFGMAAGAGMVIFGAVLAIRSRAPVASGHR